MPEVPLRVYIPLADLVQRVSVEGRRLGAVPLRRMPEPVLGAVLARSQALRRQLFLKVQIVARRAGLFETRESVACFGEFSCSRKL